MTSSFIIHFSSFQIYIQAPEISCFIPCLPLIQPLQSSPYLLLPQPAFILKKWSRSILHNGGFFLYTFISAPMIIHDIIINSISNRNWHIYLCILQCQFDTIYFCIYTVFCRVSGTKKIFKTYF